MAAAYNKTDYCSLSNTDDTISQHVHLEWVLDFTENIISGSARHSMKIVTEGVTAVIFDCSALVVESVYINHQETTFEISGSVPGLGSKLIVSIPEGFREENTYFDVLVNYSTSKTASAIQWLDKEATKGGAYPYVFTQCQAIHARSLLPCQDTPGNKITYTANVTAPSWCIVLMSALFESTKDAVVNGEAMTVHSWRQPVPIPAYLIALAAGNLASIDISPRVRVWSEPEVVQAAAYEFAETEDFLCAAESLTCPYEWVRYDVLCLPPSFPYGGMENPCLTFATPTLLAGDRSLADVIAHEIAHSWTGNLVTNHTWEYMFLNEGWTVWLERKIMSKIKGNPDVLRLSAYSGVKHLKDDVAAFDKRQKGHPFTRLVWPLRGEDPDDAFSGIPYEKGFNLLHYLETLVGTETFENFAKAYIQTFKFGTVTAGEFKDFFIRYIKETSVEAAVKIEKLDWEELLHAPGLPSYLPDFSENNALLDDVKGLSKKWLGFFNDRAQPSGVAASDIEGWSTLQKIIFLESFLDYCDEQRKLSVAFLESLDKIYSFTSYGNAEIKFRWQSLCLRCNVPWIGPHVVAFLTSQGRMKFVRPLYRALFASSFGRELALDTFDAHCDKYHPIAKKMVDADFDKTMTSYEKRKRKKLSIASPLKQPLEGPASGEGDDAPVGSSPLSLLMPALALVGGIAALVILRYSKR